MYPPALSVLRLSLLVILGFVNVTLEKSVRHNEIAQGHRSNTTAHLVFNTVSGLLQHWPNTIYRNGVYIYQFFNYSSNVTQ